MGCRWRIWSGRIRGNMVCIHGLVGLDGLKRGWKNNRLQRQDHHRKYRAKLWSNQVNASRARMYKMLNIL